MKPDGAKGTPSLVIGAGLKVTGAGDGRLALVADGDARVDGAIEGDLVCRRLTIGEAGSVAGDITAESVWVMGAVAGHVTARTVALAATARVSGGVTQETLSIEAGAEIEGPVTRLAAREPAAPEPLDLAEDQEIEDRPPAAEAEAVYVSAQVYRKMRGKMGRGR